MNIAMLRHCNPKELVRYLRDENSEVVQLLCDRIEMILDDYINPDEFVCEDCADTDTYASGVEHRFDLIFEAAERAEDHTRNPKIKAELATIKEKAQE